jgi:hypothetical protein
MEILASYYGGSFLYGLNNKDSDLDERNIFINTDPSYILGLYNNDQKVINNKEEDIVSYEVRYFFKLLEKSSLNTIEALFCDEASFISLSDEFSLIRQCKNYFWDSDKLFKAVSGFVHNQIRLGFDDNNNREKGSIRDEEIEKYGFKGKPLVHALRVLESATGLYSNGFYNVKPIKNLDLCLGIKHNPSSYASEFIRLEISKQLDLFYTVKDSLVVTNRFNHDMANKLLLKFYRKYL